MGMQGFYGRPERRRRAAGRGHRAPLSCCDLFVFSVAGARRLFLQFFMVVRIEPIGRGRDRHQASQPMRNRKDGPITRRRRPRKPPQRRPKTSMCPVIPTRICSASAVQRSRRPLIIHSTCPVIPTNRLRICSAVQRSRRLCRVRQARIHPRASRTFRRKVSRLTMRPRRRPYRAHQAPTRLPVSPIRRRASPPLDLHQGAAPTGPPPMMMSTHVSGYPNQSITDIFH